MVMPALLDGRDWTIADLDLLPDDDGNKYEIIDGVLFVSPPPGWPHTFVSHDLYALIHEYLRGKSLGIAVFPRAGIKRTERTWVEPDFFVLPLVEGRRPTSGDDLVPLLVVEVISPSSRRRDRGVKRALYQRIGTGEYWIADSYRKAIEVWSPDARLPRIANDRLTWKPSAECAPLEIDIAALFAR